MNSEQPLPTSRWPNASTAATIPIGGQSLTAGAPGTGNGAAVATAGAYHDLSRLLEQNVREENANRGATSTGGGNGGVGGLDPSWFLGGGNSNSASSNYDASSFLSNLQNEQEMRNRSTTSAAANYQNLLLQSTRSGAASSNNVSSNQYGGGHSTNTEAAMAMLDARGGNVTTGNSRQLELEILDDFYKVLQNAEQNQGASSRNGGSQANAAMESARLNVNNFSSESVTGMSNNLSQNRFSAGGSGGLDANNFAYQFNSQQQPMQFQPSQQQQQFNRSLDNYDLASLANQLGQSGGVSNNTLNSSDVAVLLALQRQQQQQQQQLQFQQQLNSMHSNNNSYSGVDQLASMLPGHRFAGFGGTPSASAYSMLGNNLGGSMLNTGNLAFGACGPSDSQQQSTLLASLLSEPLTQLDVSHGSGGSGPLFNDSMAAAAMAAGLGTGLPSSQHNRKPMTTTDSFPAAAPASVTATATSVARPALPFRALSAYNFFFRDERDRIINGGEHEFTPTKKQKLLSEHWFRDRSVKRRHRKTHGKIAFTTLSKVISQGWRDLSEEKKAFYREVAAEDLDRYQRELDQYKLIDAATLTSSTTSALFGATATSQQTRDSSSFEVDEAQLSAAQKQLNRAMAA